MRRFGSHMDPGAQEDARREKVNVHVNHNNYGQFPSEHDRPFRLSIPVCLDLMFNLSWLPQGSQYIPTSKSGHWRVPDKETAGQGGILYWLAVSTHLKQISQWVQSSQVEVEIRILKPPSSRLEFRAITDRAAQGTVSKAHASEGCSRAGKSFP